MAAIVNGPSPLDWKVYAGDRNEVQFVFEAAGVPWDLTDAALSAQARLKATDATIALSATAVLVDPVNGTATVAWDGEQVRTLLAGADNWQGVWDLQLLESGETLPITMLRGKFTAIHDVTPYMSTVTVASTEVSEVVVTRDDEQIVVVSRNDEVTVSGSVPTVGIVVPGPQGPPGPPGNPEDHEHVPDQVGFHVGPTPPSDTTLIWIETP